MRFFESDIVTLPSLEGNFITFLNKDVVAIEENRSQNWVTIYLKDGKKIVVDTSRMPCKARNGSMYKSRYQFCEVCGCDPCDCSDAA